MPQEPCYAQLTIDGVACLIRGYCQWHPRRKLVERYIADRFAATHGAHVQHFMPVLVALETSAGDLLALAGLRNAQQSALFLEHYIAQPIERVIAQHNAIEPHRHVIVEIGNLAAGQHGYSRFLFAALTDLLSHWGFEWLACTGITSVLNVFHRLGMNPQQVAPALPEKIPGGGEGWGTYYQKNPHVMIGNIELGRQRIERSGLLAHCHYSRTEVNHARIA